MSFKEQFPDYKSFDESKYYYSHIPAGLISALKGFILRFAENSTTLKSLCHDLATRIPCEPTQNWGWDWLLADFNYLVEQLSQKSFHKFMDFIYSFAREHWNETDFLDELNELFEEYDFGYRLKVDSSPWGDEIYWDLFEEPEKEAETIVSTKEEVKDICAQAKEHLEQAKDQLQKTDNPRAWKDALRDCLSAMEALVNQLGNDTKIERSTKRLREDGRWGPDIIVKEGLSIWNRMHDLYPDIRHGNPKASTLSREEALFWIDRLMAFVSYLARRKKNIFG